MESLYWIFHSTYEMATSCEYLAVCLFILKRPQSDVYRMKYTTSREEIYRYTKYSSKTFSSLVWRRNSMIKVPFFFRRINFLYTYNRFSVWKSTYLWCNVVPMYSSGWKIFNLIVKWVSLMCSQVKIPKCSSAWNRMQAKVASSSGTVLWKWWQGCRAVFRMSSAKR